VGEPNEKKGTIIKGGDCSTIVVRVTGINLLKPRGNFTYDQVYHEKILHGAHIAFRCFVRISEQTATFAL
jgi:hypothetical protein